MAVQLFHKTFKALIMFQLSFVNGHKLFRSIQWQSLFLRINIFSMFHWLMIIWSPFCCQKQLSEGLVWKSCYLKILWNSPNFVKSLFQCSCRLKTKKKIIKRGCGTGVFPWILQYLSEYFVYRIRRGDYFSNYVFLKFCLKQVSTWKL